MEFIMNGMQMQLDAVGTIATNLHTQLTNLSNTVTNLSNTINSMSSSINDIVDLYKPYQWFDFPNVPFTDGSGNAATGRFRGAWYRPIKFLPGGSNDGVDLKIFILVLRAIYISPLANGVPYNSDSLPLPISFVNNNKFGVFWSNTVTNHLMKTRQADYFLYNVPIHSWALNVHVGTSIDNDSAWFLIGYI
jgi:hypothetical protein